MSRGNIFPEKYLPTKMFTLPQLKLQKLLDAGPKLQQGREKGEKEKKASFEFDPRKPWLLSNFLPQDQQPASAICSPACGGRKQCSNQEEKARFDPRSNILPHDQQSAPTSAICSPVCEGRKQCSNLSEGEKTEEENTQFQVVSKQSC